MKTKSVKAKSTPKYKPTPYLRAILAEAEKEIASGKLKKFKSLKDLIKDLES